MSDFTGAQCRAMAEGTVARCVRRACSLCSFVAVAVESAAAEVAYLEHVLVVHGRG